MLLYQQMLVNLHQDIVDFLEFFRNYQEDLEPVLNLNHRVNLLEEEYSTLSYFKFSLMEQSVHINL